VEGRQNTHGPVLRWPGLACPALHCPGLSCPVPLISLTLHPSSSFPSPSTTSQIKRSSSSSSGSGSGSSGRPVPTPPPRISQTILGTDLLPQNGSLKGPGSTSQKSGSEETSQGVVNKAGAVAKNTGPGKMIKRVYLFADDPNSIEVLANEGDQALIMYVL
jgi:hypothetical protein